jgi:anti-sigma B factor antagonist
VPPPSPHSPEPETGPWFFCMRHAVHAGAIGIVMVGELDIAAADDARDVIGRARADAAEVICDLHDVSFIDPCGLHVLLDAAASARQDNSRLALVNPSASIRRLISMLGLQDALQADAVPCPAPSPRDDPRPVTGRARARSAPRAARTPKQSRAMPGTKSTPLIVRSSRRAARQDRRR